MPMIIVIGILLKPDRKFDKNYLFAKKKKKNRLKYYWLDENV